MNEKIFKNKLENSYKFDSNDYDYIEFLTNQEDGLKILNKLNLQYPSKINGIMNNIIIPRKINKIFSINESNIQGLEDYIINNFIKNYPSKIYDCLENLDWNLSYYWNYVNNSEDRVDSNNNYISKVFYYEDSYHLSKLLSKQNENINTYRSFKKERIKELFKLHPDPDIKVEYIYNIIVLNIILNSSEYFIYKDNHNLNRLEYFDYNIIKTLMLDGKIDFFKDIDSDSINELKLFLKKKYDYDYTYEFNEDNPFDVNVLLYNLLEHNKIKIKELISNDVVFKKYILEQPNITKKLENFENYFKTNPKERIFNNNELSKEELYEIDNKYYNIYSHNLSYRDNFGLFILFNELKPIYVSSEDEENNLYYRVYTILLYNKFFNVLYKKEFYITNDRLNYEQERQLERKKQIEQEKQLEKEKQEKQEKKEKLNKIIYTTISVSIIIIVIICLLKSSIF